MIVLILAGGLGQRLRSVVKDLPKPMALVAGKPFLAHILSQLVKQPSITEIVMSVGYKADAISSYFGENFYGIPIKYCVETEPLGTGGAIKKFVLDYDVKEPFFVKNGDTYFDTNFNHLRVIMKQYNPLMVLEAIEHIDTLRYGTLKTKNIEGVTNVAKVVGFYEKQLNKGTLINTGSYLLQPEIFRMQKKCKFSFESDLMTQLAAKGSIYCSKSVHSDFLDIGVPEDFYAAQTKIPDWRKK